MISRSPILLALVGASLTLSLSGCASTGHFLARLMGHRPVLQAQIRPAVNQTVETPVTSPADRLYEAAVQAITRRDYGGALDMLQFARQAAPNDVRVLDAMGVVYDKLGRFDLSERYYALASAAQPGSPIVAANIRYSIQLREAASRPLLALAPAPSPQSVRADGLYVADGGPLKSLSQTASAAPLIRLAATTGQVRPLTPAVTGYALAMINASGRDMAIEPARVYLASAGWSVAKADSSAPSQAHSEIRYAPQVQAIAQALSRTLPFKVTLTACASDCRLQLILGRDAPAVLPQRFGRS